MNEVCVVWVGVKADRTADLQEQGWFWLRNRRISRHDRCSSQSPRSPETAWVCYRSGLVCTAESCMLGQPCPPAPRRWRIIRRRSHVKRARHTQIAPAARRRMFLLATPFIKVTGFRGLAEGWGPGGGVGWGGLFPFESLHSPPPCLFVAGKALSPALAHWFACCLLIAMFPQLC